MSVIWPFCVNGIGPQSSEHQASNSCSGFRLQLQLILNFIILKQRFLKIGLVLERHITSHMFFEYVYSRGRGSAFYIPISISLRPSINIGLFFFFLVRQYDTPPQKIEINLMICFLL